MTNDARHEITIKQNIACLRVSTLVINIQAIEARSSAVPENIANR